MKRAFVILCVLMVVAVLLFAGNAIFLAQRADYGWRPEVSRQTFEIEHPRVMFDEGHHNASTAGFTGRYRAFASLLHADGYTVERSRRSFVANSLQGVRVLVIVNAAGADRPQLFGINITPSPGGQRSGPAFTAAEIEVIRAWVEGGGSLLLVADHAPFGESVASLASALGVGMHKGFVEVPGESSDPLVFSFDNGRLGRHPIIDGDPDKVISKVMTYTGQSLDGPPGATILLLLPRAAVESIPAGDGSFVEHPAGRAQAVAFGYGRGRVVVLGESAMVTAQVSRRKRFGMNTGDNDNQQFALNVMAWLAREI